MLIIVGELSRLKLWTERYQSHYRKLDGLSTVHYGGPLRPTNGLIMHGNGIEESRFFWEDRGIFCRGGSTSLNFCLIFILQRWQIRPSKHFSYRTFKNIFMPRKQELISHCKLASEGSVFIGVPWPESLPCRLHWRFPLYPSKDSRLGRGSNCDCADISAIIDTESPLLRHLTIGSFGSCRCWCQEEGRPERKIIWPSDFG